jgi:hypothetical protein
MNNYLLILLSIAIGIIIGYLAKVHSLSIGIYILLVIIAINVIIGKIKYKKYVSLNRNEKVNFMIFIVILIMAILSGILLVILYKLLFG